MRSDYADLATETKQQIAQAMAPRRRHRSGYEIVVGKLGRAQLEIQALESQLAYEHQLRHEAERETAAAVGENRRLAVENVALRSARQTALDDLQAIAAELPAQLSWWRRLKGWLFA